MTQHLSLSTEAIWELLSKRLEGFLRSRVSDPSTVDDLLQEVFVRIHQKLDHLEAEEQLEPWVFRIARNLVNDHYRAKGGTRGTSEVPHPDLDAFADETSSPDSDGINAAVGSWLIQSIDKLPPTYRETAHLFEVQRIPQKEIAARLNLSLSAVKSRVQRARDLLAAELDQCCRLEFDRRGNVIACDGEACRDCEDCG